MTKRSSTYLKGISETGDIANQTLFEDLIDSMGVVDSGTTFDDSGTITVDGTRVYSTTRAITASTHSLTISASGHVSGNYLKVIYSFSQACTLTLNNFFTLGNDTGTITPIPAGTYIFRFICEDSNDGVFLSIPNNIQSSQDQLTTPANFNAVAGNGEVSLSWSSVANATGYTLEVSTDQTTWTDLGTVTYDGTSTSYTNTGLTNGTPYYYRVKATASGYVDSAYSEDAATPQSGVTQLTQPTGLEWSPSPTQIILTYNAIDANADNVAIQRSTTSGSGFGTIATISRALTTYTDTPPTPGTRYYYQIIANGSGSYSNSDPSAEVETRTTTYTTFNGTTNYAYFGDILDSLFEATDTKFALELRVRNWTGNTVRLISKINTSGGNPGIHLFYVAGTALKFAYGDGTNYRIIRTSGDITVNDDDVIRVEYNGTEDTSLGVNRVVFKISGITQTNSAFTDGDGGTFPHDIANAANDSLAIGDVVTGAGANAGAAMFNADASDFRVYDSNTGGNLILRVPTISDGVDVVGSNDCIFV